MNESNNNSRDLVLSFKSIKDSEKPNIIVELEQLYLESESKEEKEEILNFFLEIAQDFDEYDLARIEVFKVFEILKLNEFNSEKVVVAINRVLDFEKDEVVKQYSIMTLANFVQVEQTKLLVTQILLDKDEDNDLRHSSLAVLWRGNCKMELEDILLKLDINDGLRKSVAVRLKYLKES